ncbi:sulfurtransferase TusA family protein (plasmid) [Haloarcula sp. NS06]|uniref:sulfurtransferase TusA family protein n=1 Tax=unclassified Haloarcula TaxID=2624677 RepID=UPI0027B51DD5|nr:sulfurtransferase TusA family protein [Haloarcula sp. H-GB4]MDQ2074573.1 sulfurtransferase TusA family protein [Haloarcula sp. H-GB4]
MTTNQSHTEADTTVDARGATCPGPLMDLISEVRAVDTGTVIALLSDAEKSPTEVREWADESGNEVLDIADEGDHYRIHVKKL